MWSRNATESQAIWSNVFNTYMSEAKMKTIWMIMF